MPFFDKSSTRAHEVSCGICKHSAPAIDSWRGQGQKVKVGGCKNELPSLPPSCALFLQVGKLPGVGALWPASGVVQATSWFTVAERSLGSTGPQLPGCGGWHETNRTPPQGPAPVSVWLSVHRWWALFSGDQHSSVGPWGIWGQVRTGAPRLKAHPP